MRSTSIRWSSRSSPRSPSSNSLARTPGGSSASMRTPETPSAQVRPCFRSPRLAVNQVPIRRRRVVARLKARAASANAGMASPAARISSATAPPSRRPDRRRSARSAASTPPHRTRHPPQPPLFRPSSRTFLRSLRPKHQPLATLRSPPPASHRWMRTTVSPPYPLPSCASSRRTTASAPRTCPAAAPAGS